MVSFVMLVRCEASGSNLNWFGTNFKILAGTLSSNQLWLKWHHLRQFTRLHTAPSGDKKGFYNHFHVAVVLHNGREDNDVQNFSRELRLTSHCDSTEGRGSFQCVQLLINCRINSLYLQSVATHLSDLWLCAGHHSFFMKWAILIDSSSSCSCSVRVTTIWQTEINIHACIRAVQKSRRVL